MKINIMTATTSAFDEPRVGNYLQVNVDWTREEAALALRALREAGNDR